MNVLDIIEEGIVGKRILLHKYNSGINVSYAVEKRVSHGSGIKYVGVIFGVVKEIDISKKKQYNFDLIVEVDGSAIRSVMHLLTEIRFDETND